MKTEFYTPLEKLSAALESAREEGRQEVIAKVAGLFAVDHSRTMKRVGKVRCCRKCGKPGHYANGCKGKAKKK